MSREIKKYVRYYLQSRKKWQNDRVQRPHPIVLSFHYNSKVLCTLTGLKMLESDWDKARQRAKPSVKRSKEVNSILDELEQKINDVYFNYLAQGIPINNTILLKAIKEDRTVVTISFWKEWERYFETHKNKHSKGTLKSMFTSFNHFKKFLKNREITFEEVNPELLADYVKFLLKRGNTNNTIHGNIKRIKIFLNYSQRVGLHNNDKYKQYNIPERVGSIKFLEWDEVKKLLDVHLDNETECEVRDLFCMCCLTAMRYSDLSNLRKTDVKEHSFKELSGIQYAIHTRQKKTDKTTVIPLLKEAIEILERYKDNDSEFALPKRALQNVNNIIKEIGKKAGIDSNQEVTLYRGNERETKVHKKHEILSTHMGRRTFVTIAATRGIPINVVASITGQNPKTTLKHYMGVIDSKKFEEMENKLKF
jgi:site-specific recombinase XerD